MRELVPGQYGFFKIGKEAESVHAIAVGLSTAQHFVWLNAKDFRAAAATFIELADYLDSKDDL